MPPIDEFPEIFFLPLAVPDPGVFVGTDFGVLSRRLPDFLQQLVNRGMPGPAGMLEVQSPPGDGPVRWEVLRQAPEPEDAFAMVPDGEDVRVVVFGEVGYDEDGYLVELTAVHAEDLESGLATRMQVLVRRDDPVKDLSTLARRLARHLHLPEPVVPAGLLTESGPAFLKFLEALDSAALLSGDLAIEVEASQREQLMQPFFEAITLDPEFGLALRLAQTTLSQAVYQDQLEPAACLRFFDECFDVHPKDGEGCVAVADQLISMGDDQRALRWYELAAQLDPPAPRGLENLGILFANRGETEAARGLWQRGLELDGHPDFCGHLARLLFAEGESHGAWSMVQRGLRRIHERASRYGEWDEDGRGSGVLLRYLVEHLRENAPPSDVVETLLELCAVLADDEDRVDLGLCLVSAGHSEDARTELMAGVDGMVHPEVRDHAQRALLALEVKDFDRRFTRAVDRVSRGKMVMAALKDFDLFLRLQPGYWPALYYSAIGRRKQGESEVALDILADALRQRPGQVDALALMAELFAERGNPKRAVECLDEAIEGQPDDVQLLSQRSGFLLDLDREMDARVDWDRAQKLAPEDPVVVALAKRFHALP